MFIELRNEREAGKFTFKKLFFVSYRLERGKNIFNAAHVGNLQRKRWRRGWQLSPYSSLLFSWNNLILLRVWTLVTFLINWNFHSEFFLHSINLISFAVMKFFNYSLNYLIVRTKRREGSKLMSQRLNLIRQLNQIAQQASLMNLHNLSF